MLSYLAIRRRARSAVFALRQLRFRLHKAIRAPVPWDGHHHPALLHFEPWRGVADGRFVHDFLGIRTDPKFQVQLEPDPVGPVTPRYPMPQPTYFELAFVLEAVLDAGNAPEFSMLELGAGYGHWLVTAAKALAATSPTTPVRLIGVEMVRQHHEWMLEHFRNNGLRPEDHRLILAAITDRDGDGSYFPELEPGLTYGHRLHARRAPSGPSAPTSRESGPLRAPRRVSCLSIRRLLGDVGPLSLVHIDVQGEELRLFRCAIDSLGENASRVIVATHSRRIHSTVRRLMARAGWKAEFDFGYRRRERTEFGHVQFLDGLLAFVHEDPPGTPTQR